MTSVLSVAESAKLASFVARMGGPKVKSLAPDLHLFHFAENDDIETSPCVFVNRNGNNMRILKTDYGLRLLKTWRTVDQKDAWETVSLRGNSYAEIAALISPGPQGKSPKELLTLLPREATHGRRKAVFRDTIYPVFFAKNPDGSPKFTITIPDGTHHAFEGRVWDSEEVATFCLASSKVITTAPPVALEQKIAERASIEDHPMFGAF